MPLVQEGVVESVDTGTSYTDQINYHINQLILNSEEINLKNLKVVILNSTEAK